MIFLMVAVPIEHLVVMVVEEVLGDYWMVVGPIWSHCCSKMVYCDSGVWWWWVVVTQRQSRRHPAHSHSEIEIQSLAVPLCRRCL